MDRISLLLALVLSPAPPSAAQPLPRTKQQVLDEAGLALWGLERDRDDRFRHARRRAKRDPRKDQFVKDLLGLEQTQVQQERNLRMSLDGQAKTFSGGPDQLAELRQALLNQVQAQGANEKQAVETELGRMKPEARELEDLDRRQDAETTKLREKHRKQLEAAAGDAAKTSALKTSQKKESDALSARQDKQAAELERKLKKR